MLTPYSRAIAAFVLSVITAGLSPNSAEAQVLTLGRTPVESFSGNVILVKRVAIGRRRTLGVRDLGKVLSDRWNQARPEIAKETMAYFKERDLGRGFRTSRNLVTIKEAGPLFAGCDERGFSIKLLVEGNHLYTKIRTPTPLASGVDPVFEIRFQCELLVDVEFAGARLIARETKLVIRSQPPIARTVTGAFAYVANGIVKIFGGSGFNTRLRQTIVRQSADLQAQFEAEIATFNSQLATAAPSGSKLVTEFNQSTRSIVLTLVPDTPAPSLR